MMTDLERQALRLGLEQFPVGSVEEDYGLLALEKAIMDGEELLYNGLIYDGRYG